MNVTSIIRERGQLTIPNSIRNRVNWIMPMSAITISLTKPDEILIKPHQPETNWDTIWKGIKKMHTITGKGQTQSAVDFLTKDRSSH